MSYIGRFIVVVCVPLLLCSIVSAEQPAKSSVVVRFDDVVSDSEINAWITSLAENVDTSVDYRFHTFSAVLVSSSSKSASELRDIAEDPIVKYVAGEQPVDLCYTPDDSLLSGQWWVENDGSRGFAYEDIDAIRAWDYATGDESVVVAIIDHGLEVDHEDLADNCLAGYDFVENSPGVPAHNHGTACAGVVGAIGDNGIGIAGVNWDVSILPLRMYYVSQCAAAIDSATAMGADVISNSWSITRDNMSQYDYDLLNDAITAAVNAGTIVVNSAGNNGLDLDIAGNERYPASFNYPLNLAVGNINFNAVLSSDSNWGVTTVDLVAPGFQVLTCKLDDEYGESSGTSFSAPIVAGAFALLRSQYPHAEPQWIVNRLLDNCEVLFQLEAKIAGGRRLNLFRMFDVNDRILPGDITDLAADADFDHVDLTWSAPGDDGHGGQVDHYEIWRSSVSGPARREVVDVQPASPTQPQSVTIGNLPAGTEILATVVAVDDDRNREVAQALFTTLDPPVIDVQSGPTIVYVETGETVERSLWVRNLGEGTLDVHIEGREPAPWLTVNPAEFSVAGYDSVEVELVISASGICDPYVQAQYDILHNDPNSYPLAHDVVAAVTPAQEISGPEGVIEFLNVKVDTAQSKKISIANIGCSDLDVEDVSMQHGTSFSVLANTGVIPPGQSSSMTITFNPRSIGHHYDTVLVLSDSPFMGTLEIPVHGHCVVGRSGNGQFRNTPNPFNPQTVFKFTPGADGQYCINIYDARGARVRQLRGYASANREQSVLWAGEDDSGRSIPSGVYFCALEINNDRTSGILRVNLVR